MHVIIITLALLYTGVMQPMFSWWPFGKSQEQQPSTIISPLYNQKKIFRATSTAQILEQYTLPATLPHQQSTNNNSLFFGCGPSPLQYRTAYAHTSNDAVVVDLNQPYEVALCNGSDRLKPLFKTKGLWYPYTAYNCNDSLIVNKETTDSDWLTGNLVRIYNTSTNNSFDITLPKTMLAQWHPNFPTLLVAQADKKAHVYTVDTEQQSAKGIYSVDAAGIWWNVAWSPNKSKNILYTSAEFGTHTFWDGTNGKKLAEWVIAKSINNAKWTSDGDYLCCSQGTGSKNVDILDTNAQKVGTLVYDDPENDYPWVEDTQGDLVAIKQVSTTAAKLFTLKTFKELATFKHDNRNTIQQVLISPDGSYVLTMISFGEIKIWKPDGTLINTYYTPGYNINMTMRPDGNEITLAFTSNNFCCNSVTCISKEQLMTPQPENTIKSSNT